MSRGAGTATAAASKAIHSAFTVQQRGKSGSSFRGSVAMYDARFILNSE